MLNYLSVALVAAVTVAALPAGAEVTYYGTPQGTTAAQEQDNADLSAASVQRPARTPSEGTDRRESQVFGYAAEPNSRRAEEASSGVYLGTAWRYQDNADIVRR